jgi:hypothetical protein
MIRRKIEISQRWTALPFLLSALAFVVIGGCDSTSDRRAISGTVSVDGKPVEKGSIMFLPDAGHRGPSASSSILDGEYRFTIENGPTAGPHRVVVGVGLSSPSAGVQSSPVAAEPTAPTSSTAAKQGPAISSSLTASSGEPNPQVVDRTQWESATTVPAADSPDSAEPIDFAFQNLDPASGPATDKAP